MMQSLYLLCRVTKKSDLRAMARFFAALGLDAPESWEGTRRPASAGTLFHPPRTGLEVGFGPQYPEVTLMVEVADADTAAAALKQAGFKPTTPPEATSWGARMFVVEPVTGHRVAVFAYLEESRQPKHTTLSGDLSATGKRFALVVSRFNSFITERLLAGALDALHRLGARDADLTVVRVPGAFELPGAARTLAETKKYDAILCLGCLLRGDTAHYDVIVNECARGIGQSMQETGVPHAFGVLTCENLEQAIDRAGLKLGNKGFEAALAAVEMASLKNAIAATTAANPPIRALKPGLKPTARKPAIKK